MASLQIKRGTGAAVAAAVFKPGELVLITGSNIVQVGDGVTPGGKAMRLQKRVFEYSEVATAGTVFSLSRAYHDCDVYINGVIQIPDYSYTLAGTSLTVSSQLPVGTLIYVVGYA